MTHLLQRKQMIGQQKKSANGADRSHKSLACSFESIAASGGCHTLLARKDCESWFFSEASREGSGLHFADFSALIQRQRGSDPRASVLLIESGSRSPVERQEREEEKREELEGRSRRRSCAGDGRFLRSSFCSPSAPLSP